MISALLKAEIVERLAGGRTILQEEWSDRYEIVAVDQLIAAGVAITDGWEYKDGFQCERRVIRGVRV